MSLMTDPRNIIIEDDDQLYDSSDACGTRDEERFLQAFVNLCEIQRQYNLQEEGHQHRHRHRIQLEGGAGTGTNMRHSSTAVEQQRRRRRRGRQQQQQQQQHRKMRPHRWDPATVDRLTASTTASRAKSQQKHVNRVSEMMNQQRTPEVKRCVSPVATKAGMRLYAAGMGQMQRLDCLRKQQAERMRREEGLTFQPQITLLARDLKGSGYMAPHERYSHMKVKLAKNRLLQEEERISRATAGCTFRPTVTAVSEKMARIRRESEPFGDVGERLFFEGGRRLIRQQLRERILEQSNDNHVIGAFQITQKESRKLVSRLLKWQEVCNHNREAAKREYIRSVSQPQVVKSKPVRHTEAPIQQNRLQSPSFDTRFLQESLDHELRQMRCRALFFKFASSEKSTSVRVQDVKRQVRELFPEDSSIAAALVADFKDTDVITQEAFVESLMRFEQIHGPQPWGQPTCDHVVSAFGTLPSELGALSKMAETLRRTNSASAATTARFSLSSPRGESTAMVKKAASARSLSHRRSSSLPAKVDSRPEGRKQPCCRHGGKGTSHVTRKLVHQGCTTKQTDVVSRPRPSVERQYAVQMYQTNKKLSANKRNAPQKVPETQNAGGESPSADSVEVSSFTEDCSSSSMPDVRRQKDIVAELEALVGSPAVRSSTASPKQCNSRVYNVKRDTASSVAASSHPKRSCGGKAPASAVALSARYAHSCGADRATQEEFFQKMEELLGMGTSS